MSQPPMDSSQQSAVAPPPGPAPLGYAGPVSYAMPGIAPYTPSYGRGRVVRGMLWANLVLDVVGAGFSAWQLTLPPDAFEGDDIPIVGVIAMVLYALSHMGVFIATAVVFCMWMYRAHKNLDALGRRDLDYSPGWAAGAWFIPILNLFRPFQIMREIWKASDASRVDEFFWKGAANPPVINGWWTLWLLGNFLSQASTRMGFSGDRGIEHAGLYVELVTVPISMGAAWLAIRITRAIDEMQAERYQSMFVASSQNV